METENPKTIRYIVKGLEVADYSRIVGKEVWEVEREYKIKMHSIDRRTFSMLSPLIKICEGDRLTYYVDEQNLLRFLHEAS